MLCVCYFEDHVDVFQPTFPDGAAGLFDSPEVGGDARIFAHVVQGRYGSLKGQRGRRTVREGMHWSYVLRADAVLEYWQGAKRLDSLRRRSKAVAEVRVMATTKRR